jgi:hypothetical protein
MWRQTLRTPVINARASCCRRPVIDTPSSDRTVASSQPLSRLMYLTVRHSALCTRQSRAHEGTSASAEPAVAFHTCTPTPRQGPTAPLYHLSSPLKTPPRMSCRRRLFNLSVCSLPCHSYPLRLHATCNPAGFRLRKITLAEVEFELLIFDRALGFCAGASNSATRCCSQPGWTMCLSL